MKNTKILKIISKIKCFLSFLNGTVFWKCEKQDWQRLKVLDNLILRHFKKAEGQEFYISPESPLWRSSNLLWADVKSHSASHLEWCMACRRSRKPKLIWSLCKIPETSWDAVKCHKNRAGNHSHAHVVFLIHLLFRSDLLSKRIWGGWRFSQYGAKQKRALIKAFWQWN